MPRWTVIEVIRSSPEKYMEMVRKRGMDVSIVHEAIDIDSKRREFMKEIEQLRKEHNLLSREISKSKDESTRKDLLQRAKSIEEKVAMKERELAEIESKWMETMKKL
ncbi:MAG: serine--tRNA ligase, partial [Fervidicoccaceae archaeon]